MSEWKTEKGKTDKLGKQAYIGTCKETGNPTISSESYGTPTCGHKECKKKN